MADGAATSSTGAVGGRDVWRVIDGFALSRECLQAAFFHAGPWSPPPRCRSEAAFDGLRLQSRNVAARALSIHGEPRTNSQTSSDSTTGKGESMSHHLDSPIARQDVRLDITDLYAFRGQVGTVFVINVCHSRKPQDPGLPSGRYVRIQS